MGLVEREHEQAPALLAQRLLRGERLELGDEQGGPPALEPGRQEPFACDRAELGEPGDLGLGPRLAGILAEGGPVPEVEGFGEQLGGPPRIGRCRRGIVDELLEAPSVDRAGGTRRA
jgi:hypothetical protein